MCRDVPCYDLTESYPQSLSDDYMRSEAHSKSHRTGDLGRGSREGRPSGQVLKMIGFQAVMGNQGYLCRLQGSGWPLCNTKGSIAATEGREGQSRGRPLSELHGGEVTGLLESVPLNWLGS